uniref:Uncharacterized protein n=1 Tax=Vespula pensylvanica TaxID=30213 RepID=A0A834PA42_VESPE|nr:hypothetical protein H0235_005369 [Vespula pensylvanica]
MIRYNSGQLDFIGSSIVPCLRLGPIVRMIVDDVEEDECGKEKCRVRTCEKEGERRPVRFLGDQARQGQANLTARSRRRCKMDQVHSKWGPGLKANEANLSVTEPSRTLKRRGRSLLLFFLSAPLG